MKKQKAIEHYNRMIVWAKTQDQKAYPCEDMMERDIQESWYGNSCIYCQKAKEASKEYIGCFSCELYITPSRSIELSDGCCNGLWVQLAKTETWEEWIKAAEKVKEYIEQNG